MEQDLLKDVNGTTLVTLMATHPNRLMVHREGPSDINPLVKGCFYQSSACSTAI